MAMLCREAKGFVYAVTMTGTTGNRPTVNSRCATDVLDYMDRVKSLSSVPVCAGFGIRSAGRWRGSRRMWTVSWWVGVGGGVGAGEDVAAFLKSFALGEP